MPLQESEFDMDVSSRPTVRMMSISLKELGFDMSIPLEESEFSLFIHMNENEAGGVIPLDRMRTILQYHI